MNTPWRIPVLAMLVMALALAACGGSGGGGGGGDDVSDLPDVAEASSEDAEGTVYPLQEGRYRLTWSAPDCEEVVVSIATTDGSFTYEQAQRVRSSFVRDMPDGEYTVAVTSGCDEWTITLDKF